MVKDLGNNRNGKRKQMFEPTNMRGGKRVKDEGNSLLNVHQTKWLHEDALDSSE